MPRPSRRPGATHSAIVGANPLSDVRDDAVLQHSDRDERRARWACRELRRWPDLDRALQLLHLELQRPVCVRRVLALLLGGHHREQHGAQVPFFDRPSFTAWKAETGTDVELDQRRPAVRFGDGPPAARRLSATRGRPVDRRDHDGHRRRPARQPADDRRLRERRWPAAASASTATASATAASTTPASTATTPAQCAGSSITINDVAPATPYPSTCVVSGVSGRSAM